MKHRSYFIVPAFIVILLCIRTRSEAEPLLSSVNISTLGCTGTVAECLDQNEEFQLDSHESRRILANNLIDVSKALIADQAFCDEKKYANCLPDRNGKPKDRYMNVKSQHQMLVKKKQRYEGWVKHTVPIAFSMYA
ncbi:hypothetical protein AAG906_013326 [Vitis piasezkii]